MYRRLIASACALGLAPGAAAAQDEEPTSEVEAEVPEPPESTQRIGGQLGLEGGGRTSPGGFAIGGSYIYRLTETDWLDGGVSFTFGSASAACFRDRDDQVLCDHGLLKGFAAEVSAGVRRDFAGQDRFTPFARVGLAVRLVSFGDDDVKGAAVPVVVGGGVRAQVADRIAVVGGATLRAGIGILSGDVGVEPHASLAIHFGVEFGLD